MAKDRMNEETEATEQTADVKRQEFSPSAAEKEFEALMNAETVVENDVELPNLYVYRRRYTNKADGKQYWEYILPASFMGRLAEVHFKASDVGGYELLDYIFSDGLKKAGLKTYEVKSYNEKVGLIKRRNYEVFITKDGTDWIVPVSPQRGSDRAIIENYIRYLYAEAKKAKAENK